MQWRVVVADLVDDLGIGLERHVSVGEADRNQNLIPCRRGQDDARVPAVGGRAPSQIDGHVEYRPPHHAHELVLGTGRFLEVQPAHRPRVRGRGVVVLYEFDADSGIRERSSAVHFGEEPAAVAELRRGSAP